MYESATCLSCARRIQSTSSYPLSLRSMSVLSSHLGPGLPSGLFASGFLTENRRTPLPSDVLDFTLFTYVCRTFSSYGLNSLKARACLLLTRNKGYKEIIRESPLYAFPYGWTAPYFRAYNCTSNVENAFTFHCLPDFFPEELSIIHSRSLS